VQKITPSYLSANPLPDHRNANDKQQRGRALVIAGSVEIAGAALLASLGALRAGAGILQVATCRASAAHLRMAMPEALVVDCDETPAGGIHPSAAVRLAELASDCDAVLVGPGMVDEAAVAELTLGLLNKASRASFILDAEAFVQMRDHLGVLQRQVGRLVVTPHTGEMAKFLNVPRDQIDEQPEAFGKKACDLTGAVVALKGAITHIVSPSAESWMCNHGCIGLATSGSGDTLAGILSGLVARGARLEVAAIWGTYLHAEAGQRLTKRHGAVGFLAREIPDEIPRIMEDLRKAKGSACPVSAVLSGH
jgi:ADP-dependent NAD(P)H-hydrate dehydratase